MTNSRPVQDTQTPDPSELDLLWGNLRDNLASYLAAMVDPDEADHLIIELPDTQTKTETTPYAQFAGFDRGRMLRAELAGNAYLRPAHRLDDEADTTMRALGWLGNGDSGANWFIERPIDAAAGVAVEAVRALRHVFGIVHPLLFTHQAWGPATENLAVLGLGATEDVPVEAAPPPRAGASVLDQLVVTPANRDELVKIVSDLLREQFESDPVVDDDGDFVLQCKGQTVWIRVAQDTPAVEVFSCVAQKVHSRRAAAVEVGLLNRDHRWMKWVLNDRQVWQTLTVPGRPFVPPHLAVLLGLFLEALEATRDDLTYRTGSRTV